MNHSSHAYKSIIRVVALLLLCHQIIWAGTKTQADPPNIFFILIEDVGMQLGHNTPGLETPTLDSLAVKGIRFDEAYCAYPTCSPSKTSTMTGVYAHRHHTVRNTTNLWGVNPEIPDNIADLYDILSIPDSIPTLIECLQNAGYYTGLTRKLHMCPNPKFPFDEWIKDGSETVIPQFIANSKDAGKPFFMMFNINDCHRPYKSHINAYGWPRVDENDVLVPDYLPNTPLMREDWADYLTTIEIIDDKIRKAISVLLQHTNLEETIVIITSDHGPSIHRGKFSPFHFGSHIPLIIFGKGVSAGTPNNELVSHMDIMPTLLDIIGYDAQSQFHGRSIRPMLEGDESAKGHRFLITEVQYALDMNYRGLSPDAAHDYAIYDGTYRYIMRKNTDLERWQPADNYNVSQWQNYAYQATVDAKDEFPLAYRLLQEVFGHAPEEEFFDISHDYWCTNNLLDSSAYKNQVADLKSKLEQFISDERIYPPSALPSIFLSIHELTVYPNPANENITLIADFDSPRLLISLMNMSGKLMYQNQFNDVIIPERIKIPVANLTSGNYYVIVQSNLGTMYSQEFIKL